MLFRSLLAALRVLAFDQFISMHSAGNYALNRTPATAAYDCDFWRVQWQAKKADSFALLSRGGATNAIVLMLVKAGSLNRSFLMS